MPILNLILFLKNKKQINQKRTLLLTRMNCVILHLEILIPNNRQGLQHNRFFLSLNDRGLHILWSVVAINLSSLRNFGDFIVLVELLLELEVLLLEVVPDLCACMELSILVLELL